MDTIAHLPSVLIVDDDDLNLQTFTRVFRRETRLTCARSGEEALELLAARTFDLLFVDHSMPGISGKELLQRLTSFHPAMKRVLLSAYGDLPEFRELKAAGQVAAIVQKPWDKSQIDSILNEWRARSTP